MITPEYAIQMARYNADMNRRLYDAAAQLPPGELTADRKAYFGSLCGTMNHLLTADTIWLGRFASHPANYAALEATKSLTAPTSLQHSYGNDLAALRAYREQLDAIISAWAPQIRAADLASPFSYRRMTGEAYRKPFGAVLMHFFNHQTHHRGQCSTLLTQAGVDIGVTDLLAWIAEVDA